MRTLDSAQEVAIRLAVEELQALVDEDEGGAPPVDDSGMIRLSGGNGLVGDT